MKHKIISISLTSLLLCGCMTNEPSKYVQNQSNLSTEKVESKESAKKSKKQSNNQKKVQQEMQTEIEENPKSESVNKASNEPSKTKQEVKTSKQPTKTPPTTSKPKPDVHDTKERPKETITTPPPVKEPSTPSYACPHGKDQNLTCDTILDNNFYYKTFSSETDANNEGYYLMNEVCYIGNLEITNFSVQPVYRNDHSIAYYGLNLWSNSTMIQ